MGDVFRHVWIADEDADDGLVTVGLRLAAITATRVTVCRAWRPDLDCAVFRADPVSEELVGEGVEQPRAAIRALAAGYPFLEVTTIIVPGRLAPVVEVLVGRDRPDVVVVPTRPRRWRRLRHARCAEVLTAAAIAPLLVTPDGPRERRLPARR